MKKNMIVLIAAVSVFALAALYANAQMYNYNSMMRNNANNNQDYSGFTNAMQQEMNEVSGLQQQYQSGQITQEQYNQGLQEHLNDMSGLHQQYGVGCPMAGAAPGYGGMMGMMW